MQMHKKQHSNKNDGFESTNVSRRYHSYSQYLSQRYAQLKNHTVFMLVIGA
jgi:hypothetical protein